MESIENPGVGFFIQAFKAMPVGQVIFLLLAAIVWLIGVNILHARHKKRVGKNTVSGLNPFAQYNSKERSVLLLLFVLASIFGMTALSWS